MKLQKHKCPHCGKIIECYDWQTYASHLEWCKNRKIGETQEPIQQSTPIVMKRKEEKQQ